MTGSSKEELAGLAIAADAEAVNVLADDFDLLPDVYAVDIRRIR